MYSDNVSGLKILGIPSKDGRGPDISVISSVAISAQTSEKKGSIAFVKSLLSEDAQMIKATLDGSVPVNKAVYRKAAGEAVDRYNAAYARSKRIYGDMDLKQNRYAWHTIDKSSVDDFEAMITTCEKLSSTDPSIRKIIDEEMPAYFAGQKDLDQVIKIINDRAQTYLNERK